MVNRALLWLERREWDKAIADLQTAIRQTTRAWHAVEVLAGVYGKQDKPVQAVEQFTRAIELKPDLAAALPQLEPKSIAFARTRPHPTANARSTTWRRPSSSNQRIVPFSPLTTPIAVSCCTSEAEMTRPLRPVRERSSLPLALLEAHRLRIDVLRKLKRHREVISSCDVLLTDDQTVVPSSASFEVWQSRTSTTTWEPSKMTRWHSPCVPQTPHSSWQDGEACS